MKRRRFWLSLGLHGLLTPLALLWLAPLWLMLVFSTLPEHEIFRVPTPLLPGGGFFENLASLQADTNFFRALANSLLVSLLYTLGGLLLSALAGYALAVYRFRLQGLVFSLIVATLTIPYFVVLIPQYILVARELKLTNTYWGVVLPFLANALGVFYMRQVFLSLPSSLLDAGRVDGASEGRIFFQIALPMVTPSLAALALILFLNAWNDYLWPLLVLSQKEMYTAPVALGTLIGLTRVSWGGIMVGSVLMTAPFLVLFLLLQRYFVAGITAGAVKE
ncbi:ABC transporter permease [Thermus scotoductus]|uniref:ABC transporter permease n=1 Tax=Thermus scotoductus TaxID=37636 RepID=A0A430VUN5_THESC|nr:carbohydrate ABC transporter permease [Thermus scotoductus]RTG91785.1 ABC transporter permease [Thermus scotoductus]RTG99956.1 ABC transporter permease [Thermus scotoductus]RTH21920.1 ABC transporter permease [Thermus scotoductus]RTH39283.1 ABC transporter permease [Thermus scotoductus]RTI60826.1 ABC transporter permease [Thermus scotoductus]